MSVAWWALGVSALSFIVAASALTWNIYSFRRNGPMISMKLTTSRQTSAQAERPKTRHYWERAGMTTNGDFVLRRLLLQLEIYNKGRSPIDVMSLSMGVSGADISRGQYVFTDDDPAVRLDHGSGRKYEIDFIDILDDLTESEKHKVESFYADAHLGNGTISIVKIPYSRWLQLLESVEDRVDGFTDESGATRDESAP